MKVHTKFVLIFFIFNRTKLISHDFCFQINCGCHHSALLTEKGHVYTWGRNLDAQLGNGARVKETLYPTHITIGV